MVIFKTPLMINALFTMANLFSSVCVPKTLIIRKALFIMAIIRTLLVIIINYTSEKGTFKYSYNKNLDNYYQPFENGPFQKVPF